MREYQQLTQGQRYQIYALLKTGHSQKQIADTIGVHRSSISRKVRRNWGKRGKLPNRVSIEARPVIVGRRERLGDWEIDTVVGKGYRGALVTLTERKSRLALIYRVPRRQAEAVAQAALKLFSSLSEFVHSITSDNEKEFPQHKVIAAALQPDF